MCIKTLPTVDGVPLLIPFSLAAITMAAASFGALPKDMLGGLAVIVGLGMLLGPLGNRLPLISRIGGGALTCLMIPSLLVYLGAFNDETLAAVTLLMKQANFLYLVIAVLVVGSILGMHRATMVSALVRIFPPLVIGTAAAIVAGLAVAMAFGYEAQRAFFYIVVPIIGGGVGEGVIPLSAAYASATGGVAGDYVAQLMPAAIIGNIVAIASAGVLRRLGERRPELDGGGALVKSGARPAVASAPPEDSDAPASIALGVLTVCGAFVFATLLEHLVHLPAPVLLIVTAVVVKLVGVVPVAVERAVRAVYSVIARHFIQPTMVGLGLVYLPMSSVVGVLSPGYVAACAAVVLAMVSAGLLVGRLIRMYPIDAALVTVCHSGLGGTGDVAILSASDRMNLMPFAQISTRIGGVCTVVSAAALIRVWQ
ncbi:2-hydroxycarboxylate transporter family protein [Nocardia pseudobrasiliensis]|uniref:Malate:Na+ symporter n=1 Tax=Nocardia pseudobrasiliensis TaxID=45979 RepID=A0A370HWG1_9NOCA|nr:2-hydroxycarboxylate transporter family protein [Nocardia pseudobrasiliensis]RDI62839.1 malate:Na+ symporter [Nocardia pseudobrasiliensis]